MPRTYRVGDLAGAHVLLTGVTERIELALLERLLTVHHRTRICVLVPPQGNGRPASQDEWLHMLLSKKAFGPWRDRIGAGQAMAEASSRLTVVEGDAGNGPLLHGIDVVIHCAPADGADEPADSAFRARVSPLVGLCGQLSERENPPHLVYVSTTCFSGTEQGIVHEAPLAHDADWRAELALALAARDDAERAARRPERLRRQLRSARRAHRGAGPRIVAQEAEAACRAWVRRRLVEQARQRARMLGRGDIHALAKVLTERVAEELWKPYPLTILRPAPVGPSLRRPYPGWSEGDAPALPSAATLFQGIADPADTLVDIVPADLVADAALAAAATPACPGAPHYFHLGTGTANPLTLEGLRTLVRKPYDVAVPALPWSRLRRTRPYGTYSTSEVRYDDAELTALREACPEPAGYGFDVSGIDWREYLETPERALAGQRLAEPVAQREAPSSLLRPLPPEADVVAVFDLDGTILASDLVESYVWTRLAALPYRSWPAELLDLIGKAPRYLLAERQDRTRFVHAFLRRYAGTDESTLSRLVHEAVGDTLLHRVRPEAVRRIREHRAAGHRTVLVTGTLDVLVVPLRPLFHDIEACRMRTRAGVMTGQVSSPPIVGEARADWLRRYAVDHGLDLTRSYAYADSYSDRAFLETAGRPCAVNPDDRLLRHAVRRRWPVVRWGTHTTGRWEALVTAAALSGHDDKEKR